MNRRLVGAIYDELRQEHIIQRCKKYHKIKQFSLDEQFSIEDKKPISKKELFISLNPGLSHVDKEDMANKMLNLLGNRDKIIFQKKFWGGKTLKDIGNDLKLSESRVCQLYNRAINSIKNQVELIKV